MKARKGWTAIDAMAEPILAEGRTSVKFNKVNPLDYLDALQEQELENRKDHADRWMPGNYKTRLEKLAKVILAENRSSPHTRRKLTICCQAILRLVSDKNRNCY